MFHILEDHGTRRNDDVPCGIKVIHKKSRPRGLDGRETFFWSRDQRHYTHRRTFKARIEVRKRKAQNGIGMQRNV